MRIINTKMTSENDEVYVEHTVKCVNQKCNQEDIEVKQKVE